LHEHEHIETFFTDLRDTHVSGVGVKETSYYPYLSNLLNTIGKKLKPRVRCIIHPRSIGAGLPEGALITTDQKSSADDPLIAAGITMTLQGIFVALNIEGDHSLVYWETCVAVLIVNYLLYRVLQVREWTGLPMHALSGFLAAVGVGCISLRVYTGTFPNVPLLLSVSGLTHPTFGMLLVDMWCLFLGAFGMVFSSLLWFLDRRAAVEERPTI